MKTILFLILINLTFASHASESLVANEPLGYYEQFKTDHTLSCKNKLYFRYLSNFYHKPIVIEDSNQELILDIQLYLKEDNSFEIKLTVNEITGHSPNGYFYKELSTKDLEGIVHLDSENLILQNVGTLESLKLNGKDSVLVQLDKEVMIDLGLSDHTRHSLSFVKATYSNFIQCSRGNEK